MSRMVKRKKKVEVEEKPVREPKLNLKMTWREVLKKQHNLMVAMIVLMVMSGVLLVFSLTLLRPQSSVVVVGYTDVYGEITGLSGGYRRDNWMSMLAFPILAVIFGVVHNVIALRVYRKYGKNMAMAVVVGSMVLVLGAVVMLIRLLGEW